MARLKLARMKRQSDSVVKSRKKDSILLTEPLMLRPVIAESGNKLTNVVPEVGNYRLINEVT
jgi:hypothetical protein